MSALLRCLHQSGHITASKSYPQTCLSPVVRFRVELPQVISGNTCVRWKSATEDGGMLHFTKAPAGYNCWAGFSSVAGAIRLGAEEFKVLPRQSREQSFGSWCSKQSFPRWIPGNKIETPAGFSFARKYVRSMVGSHCRRRYRKFVFWMSLWG